MENPDILLLDEPFNAIDKESLTLVFNAINEFRNSNKTVVLASHSNMDTHDLIIDHIVHMDSGKILRL